MRIYIDMDNVLCDYDTAHQNALREEPGIQFPQSQYGFFANLQPIQNAVDSVFELSKSNEVYILTAPSIQNPLSYIEKRVWIEKWLGIEFVERLIISPNKSLCHGDILIDDHLNGNGQELFSGRLIHFGSSQYPTWTEVLSALVTN